MDRLINRSRQGDLGEASAIEWLTSIGATVLIPFGHSPHFDLVAEIEDSRLVRVQVKTSVCRRVTPDGHGRWAVTLVTNGGNRSWSGVAKKLDPRRFDYLFVLVGDGRRWLIPSPAIKASTGIILGGPKFSEFEVEPGTPVAKLVYGPERHASRIERPSGGAPTWESRAGL
ncbi:MAG TPA: group I intron-associated PD-(D/E)XK endonuclease [Solirubrobacterales bacterium]|nr:group I intron-associated PD-(D/E)XK endonuclease [Solirubrobacterales bacterium]